MLKKSVYPFTIDSRTEFNIFQIIQNKLKKCLFSFNDSAQSGKSGKSDKTNPHLQNLAFPHKIKVRYIFIVLIKFMNSEIKMFSESSKTTCFEAFSFSAFVHTHTDTDQSINITNKHHNRGCDQTEVPLAFILKEKISNLVNKLNIFVTNYLKITDNQNEYIYFIIIIIFLKIVLMHQHQHHLQDKQFGVFFCKLKIKYWGSGAAGRVGRTLLEAFTTKQESGLVQLTSG